MTDTDTQLSSTQVSSHSDSSLTTLQQSVAPNYVSARSADVILSEVRPTRMKSEALRSLNVLLDELLWLILGSARSFSPERLRVGLLRVLPTTLGKNALLEAEVELRAYLDRNPSGPVVPVDDSTIQRFPFQSAFELLRMKCEAYSSLGDQEENAEFENALYSRMLHTAKDVSIPLSSLAPAALYLTAILEHICEHILSSIGRVVARDSSRTTAHSSDLYTALCEDEAIYALFKTMKVQDQIEQQSKLVSPRRSKSSSRNDTRADVRVGSPDLPNTSKPRPSIDSAISNGSSSNLANRPSTDKSRTKAFFKSSLTDHKYSGDNLRRTNSLIGDKQLYTSTINDDIADESTQDFDLLMRSGNTMKVSLTPDRLKTFEVFSKEKNLRASRAGPQSHPRDTNISPLVTTPSPHIPRTSTRSRAQVEAIAEAPETDLGRSRSASVSGLSPGNTRPSTPRTRSYTEVQVVAIKPFEHQNQGETRSSSLKRPTMPTAVAHVDPNNFKKNRRPPARHRESLDLDEIMDGSDEELPLPKKPALTPKSAQSTSTATRDLLQFLSEGPPEPISPPASTASATFLDGRNAKSGRFRNIVSRLTGSTVREEPAESVLRSSLNNPIRPTPLNTKRSIPNVSARAALLQTSYPQDGPISPTRTQSTSGFRKVHSEMDHSKDLTEVAVKKPADNTSIKSVPRHLNGRDPEHSYPSTPRKPVPSLNMPNTSTANPPSSPNTTQQNKTLTHMAKKELVSSSNPDPSTPNSGVSLSLPEEDIRAFQKQMARAGTVEECCILFDMMLSRCHLPKNGEKPNAIPEAKSSVKYPEDVESHVVEVLLGESGDGKFHDFHSFMSYGATPAPDETVPLGQGDASEQTANLDS